MCQTCDCEAIIEQGPRVILDRAIAIIKGLGVTLENMEEFEDAERICDVISAKTPGSDDAEVARIAQRVAEFHRNAHGKRNQALVNAARDVFTRMPAEGDRMEVITAWHRLEQLCHKLDDDVLSSIEADGIAEILRGVQHIHDNQIERRKELLRRYGLEGF
ncbi:MAG: hypothetical protein HYY30_00685 [Chloroflexi bacterium]|nr:hypothetical protein [Chloroflexota bacterium]